MKHVEGAAAPFPFYTWCTAGQRQEALLNHALQAFQDGYFADALLAVEAVSRSAKTTALPLILRARIVEACRPELAARAWYGAWLRDPENPVLQDTLLNCWLQMQAVQKVCELGPVLLPGRCQRGTQASLLTLLRRADLARVGACWVDSGRIFGRVFCLDSSQSVPTFVQMHNESDGQISPLMLTGPQLDQFDLPWPDAGSVFSFSIGDTQELIPGSPLCRPDSVSTFAPTFASTSAPDPASASLATKNVPRKTSRRASVPPQTQALDVIVPVFRGLAQVKACLESVLLSLPFNQCRARLIVLDDASPEPQLAAWLDELSRTGQCVLLRNRHNLGFVETVNRALSLKDGHDVVLLNADTLVHGNWLDRMLGSLYAAPDLASVTAWSNNGEISSFPLIAQAALAPSLAELAVIDDACATLPGPDPEIPVCCGFAMMMRRSVLDQIGFLDGAGFGRGYGEEVDWCLRARARGYRHHLAIRVFIAHVGGISFGVEKVLRVRQNRAVLQTRYPTYYPEYDKFVQADGLRSVRLALESRLQHDPWLRRLSATPALFLPPSLPARGRWLAVWHFEVDSACSKQVLALARALAGLPQPAMRLIVCGEISNALWHTGVVDHLPIGSSKDTLFSDPVLLALCGCVALLSEPQHRIALDLPYYPLDSNFEVEHCLAHFCPDQSNPARPAHLKTGT